MNALKVVLLTLTLVLPLNSRGDAPMENYLVNRAEIPDEVLQNTYGVLTVGLLSPQADTNAYAGTPSSIPLYRHSDNGFVADGVLRAEAIVTPSDCEYDGVHWYRFPITATQGDYLQLVCNLPEQRRCWVKPAELAKPWSPHGAEPPQPLWFDKGSDPFTVDIFFLSHGNEIQLYDRPSTDSPRLTITPSSKQLSSYGAYDPRALQLNERKNGFGHLVEVTGCDTPPRSIGWVRLRDSAGMLQIWPIMGLGC